MSLSNDLRAVFNLRNQIEEISQGNDYSGIKQCWEKEITLLTADMNETLRYLEDECTGDDFGWISEVFDDVAEITQSRRFIEALRKLAIKYPKETKDYNIIPFIDSAEACIWDESNS